MIKNNVVSKYVKTEDLEFIIHKPKLGRYAKTNFTITDKLKNIIEISKLECGLFQIIYNIDNGIYLRNIKIIGY